MLFHFVARCWPGLHPLEDPEHASWLWGQLETVFPDAVAACLMPNHLHVIAPAGDPRAARERLARTLGWFSRRHPFEDGVGWWRPPAEPQPIPDRHHLRRQVRYVLLNPCRARLVDDPLAWPWSTARDILGGVFEPWVTAERLADLLGEPVEEFAAKFHRYVSGDPTVAVLGTPFPEPSSPQELPAVPLTDIRAAACAATRTVDDATLARRGLPRTVFIQLALHQGWPPERMVAFAAGVSRRTVRRHAAAPWADGDLEPALLALGDLRVRRGFEHVGRSAWPPSAAPSAGRRGPRGRTELTQGG